MLPWSNFGFKLKIDLSDETPGYTWQVVEPRCSIEYRDRASLCNGRERSFAGDSRICMY